MTTSLHWRDIPVFQIGNRQDISGWQTDPRLALLQRHRVGLVMVPPVGLDEFISSDHFLETPTQFIHGAKGSGKTSLLLAKRALLDQAVADRKVLCVPTAFPYVFSPFMDDTTISFETWESLGFAERDEWKYAWLVLLGAYVLNALDRDVAKNIQDKDRPEPLLSVTLVRMLAPDRGDDQLLETRWIGCFKTLIENVRGNPLETLRRVYESEILPHLQGLIASRQKPLFVFVDGIDETFPGPWRLTPAQAGEGEEAQAATQADRADKR